MSLTDRTNERILLSQHVGDLEGFGELVVDADQDSSFNPPAWVFVALNDCDHDFDCIKLTYEEAGLLHDRLGLILGRATYEDGLREAARIVRLYEAWDLPETIAEAIESEITE